MKAHRNIKSVVILALTCLYVTGSAQAAKFQRSIVIEPYPKEKLEQLERNIATISVPAQELVNAMTELQEAKKQQQQNSTPASKAGFNKAAALAIDRVSRFVDAARTTKTPLALGFEDLADYLDVNAVSMKQHVKKNPEVKRTVEYMQKQAKAIRDFSKDFEEMVDQLEQVGDDLSARASGWVASSRIIGMMHDVYGSGGTESVYNTMSQVVEAMASLKSIFSTEPLIEGSFDSEKKDADLRRAKENYKKAIDEYYQK